MPTFLVIGAMKAGTTSLYEYLRSHPQVFLPDVKELDYFAERINWRKGLGWYEHQFDAADGAEAVGEASTSYTKYPEIDGVPERVASLLPDVRLIYVVRHPIERMHSQYLHEVLMGEERRPAEAVLATDPTYLNYSKYWMQISRYIAWFPPEQVLVITAEALRNERRETLARIYEFLGVDPSWWSDNLWAEYHRTDEKRVARPLFDCIYRARSYQALSRRIPESVKSALRPLTARRIVPESAVISLELDRWLQDALRQDVAALRAFLGPSFEGWGLL